MEIVNIMNSIRSNTAPGYDEITPKIVNSVQHRISLILSHIINVSFQEGVFPDELKIAEVVPIYKDGPHDRVENYRPISVLPYFSKIFERCMYNRMVTFLEKHKLIAEQQFGFRRKRSTELALLDFVNAAIEAIEENKYFMSTVLDLKKAFDTVDHHMKSIPAKPHKSILSHFEIFNNNVLRVPVMYRGKVILMAYL